MHKNNTFETDNVKTSKGSTIMAKAKIEKKKREISPKKKELVKQLAGFMDSKRTVMITSSLNIPSSLFQKIRKSLRGKAEVLTTKKSLGIRAIEQSKKEGLKDLANYVKEGSAFIFSDSDPYELATVFIENKQKAKAKPGQMAPEDLIIEKGPTELLPGPAISELGAVGLKVGVEGGKIAIKETKVLVKQGEVITKPVSDTLQKLGMLPFVIGIEPLAAYDTNTNKIYTNIVIDREGFTAKLKQAFATAHAFAVNIAYPCKETISDILQRAEREALALEKLIKPAENAA